MIPRPYLIYTLIIFLIVPSGKLFAHEGGHYHTTDKDILNSWLLKDGKTILGNFSSGNEDHIILEQYEGKLLHVAINDLSEQDQKLARFKLGKYKRFNRPIVPPSMYTSVSTNAYLNGFWLLCSLLSGSIILYLLYRLYVIVYKSNYNFKNSVVFYNIILLTFAIVACKKSTVNVVPPVDVVIPKTSTSFIDSAFAPFKPFISTSWDANYFHVAATGFPQHNMMVGITSWQQQVPIPQAYTGTNSWSIPLQPVMASVPLSTKTNLMKGAVAIAVNGIPIFNAFNNRGVDSYLTGELDNWGGHCGRADDYHYHAAPLHLSGTTGNLPIAFALDGFPVYGSSEPDGTAMQQLDTCHGHSLTTNSYHYHGTNTYPYVVGAMRGIVVLDPATQAPENQILPQAFASPVRPALTPLSGAVITAFQSVGANAFKLTYQRGNKLGFVEYGWDASNKYTFKLTDTAGIVTINNYQR